MTARFCIALAIALSSAACANAESTAAPPPTPGVVAAPASPCVQDADCRVESASGCACIAVLASSPPGPGCPHPCVVDPCMGNEGFCHTATSTCRVRPASR